jgi:hypothetical protein
MPWKRSLAVVLLSASTLVAVAGCTVARKTSAPVTSGADAPPQKEYQWQDMSQGKEIFGDRSKATPVN